MQNSEIELRNTKKTSGIDGDTVVFVGKTPNKRVFEPHFDRVKNNLPGKQSQNSRTTAFLRKHIYIAVHETF